MWLIVLLAFVAVSRGYHFFSAIIVLVLSSFGMKLMHHYYKLTTERNVYSLGFGPLGSGFIGPGSCYSLLPQNLPQTIQVNLMAT